MEKLIGDGPAVHLKGSRGIAHTVKSRCILNSLIQTKEGVLRVITSHFYLTDGNAEITQQLEMAKMVSSIVKYSKKDIPTIFSGDLNIRAQSYTVFKISEELECHTTDLADSLSENHIAKQADFPLGLTIDHVFSSGLHHVSTEAVEIEFSDHKALVSEFSLGTQE